MRHPAVIAATTLLGLVASATVAFADVTVRWVAVDAVASSAERGVFGIDLDAIHLRGVLDGASTAVNPTYAVAANQPHLVTVLDQCERLALLALSRP